MADGPDWKAIGLGAKDVIVGVLGAVAGAYGGSEGAKAVNNAGTGIDKIVGAAMPEEKATRSEKFDRADLPTKRAASSGRVPAPPSSTEESGETEPQGGTDESAIAADFLKGRGWSREKIRQILSGPDEASVHQIAARETRGIRVQGGRGSRVSQAPGLAVPDTRRGVREVAGRRVAPASTENIDAVAAGPLDNSGPAAEKPPEATVEPAVSDEQGG